MFFRDFYHRHPHGAPLGGLVLLLAVILLAVMLAKSSKD
jgi:hypothetical protein